MDPTHSASRRLPLAAALLAVLLVGCGDGGPHEITDVRDMKRIPPRDRLALTSAERFGIRTAGGHGASASRGAPSKPRYQWALPAGWTEVPVRAMQMRDASFQVPGGVDVSLLVGPPSALLANVNRWRGFMGAEALAGDVDLKELAFQTARGNQGLLLDVDGTYTPRMGDAKPDQRFLGFLLLAEDHLLSARMLGPQAAVAESRSAFLGFVRSLERSAVAPPAAGHMGAGHPDAGAMPRGGATGGLRQRLTWTDPEGWSSERSKSGMRVASFRIDAAPKLDVPLMALQGDGGGLEPTIAMWAGNVGGKAPTPEELKALEHFDLLGGDAVFVELTGTREIKDEGKVETTLLGMICFLGDQALFLRVQGPSEDVLPLKDAFRSLGRSLRLAQ